MEVYIKDCKYFFTADTEFNHSHIIQYCNRPFNSISHMNQEIIARWNSMVGKDDVVFHLGDVGRNCDDLVTQLNGKIIYVKGGHDHGLTAPMIREIRIQGMRDEYGNDRIIVLCHYSMRSWKNSHYASYMLYGHHHGRLESWGLSFDVGQDTHNFYPYSLKEVEEKMKTLKPIVDFRKKP